MGKLGKQLNKVVSGYPPKNHWGDCTIYAAMANGDCTDGICTCGYGLYLAHDKFNYSEVYSKERDQDVRDSSNRKS